MRQSTGQEPDPILWVSFRTVKGLGKAVVRLLQCYYTIRIDIEKRNGRAVVEYYFTSTVDDNLYRSFTTPIC